MAAINVKPTIWSPVLGCVLALVLASCGNPSVKSTVLEHSASPTKIPTGVRYVGPITAPTSYARGVVTLSVPPLSVTPTVSWETAYASCASGNAICEPGVSMTISLASASDTRAGIARSNGSIIPVMNHTLVYVFLQNGAPCAPVGPPSSGAAGPARVLSCTILNFVDANTGAVLYSVQGPKL